MTVAAVGVPASADGIPSFQSGGLSVRPIGRMLIDGAFFMPGGDGLDAGVAMPDIRLGAKVAYLDHWSAKFDIGFGYGKLSLKDVYLQYAFDSNNLLRGGYFVHHFGLNSATSSSTKPAMEAATTDDFFHATDRNLGVMYVYDYGKFFATASAIIAGASLTKPTNEQGKTSYGGATRLLFRPLHSEGFIAQFGVSGWVQSALHRAVDEDGGYVVDPGYFDFSACFPTRVCTVPMLGAYVPDSRRVVKFTPEMVLAKGRMAIEGQYYYMSVSRRNTLPAYRASGAYGLLRGILIGEDYTYDHYDAGIATPSTSALEIVIGYDYTDGSCSAAGIYGGRSNDASLTLNYYFNKYVSARLRYSYTDVIGSDVCVNRHVNTVQARIQIVF